MFKVTFSMCDGQQLVEKMEFVESTPQREAAKVAGTIINAGRYHRDSYRHKGDRFIKFL